MEDVFARPASEWISSSLPTAALQS